VFIIIAVTIMSCFRYVSNVLGLKILDGLECHGTVNTQTRRDQLLGQTICRKTYIDTHRSRQIRCDRSVQRCLSILSINRQLNCAAAVLSANMRDSVH